MGFAVACFIAAICAAATREWWAVPWLFACGCVLTPKSWRRERAAVRADHERQFRRELARHTEDAP